MTPNKHWLLQIETSTDLLISAPDKKEHTSSVCCQNISVMCNSIIAPAAFGSSLSEDINLFL